MLHEITKPLQQFACNMYKSTYINTHIQSIVINKINLNLLMVQIKTCDIEVGMLCGVFMVFLQKAAVFYFIPTQHNKQKQTRSLLSLSDSAASL